MIFDKIHPVYFFIAFAFGLFYCYITKPQPQVVMKFPTPVNAGKIVYKHTDGSCYKYKADKTECPLDRSKIKDQPLSEDFQESK